MFGKLVFIIFSIGNRQNQFWNVVVIIFHPGICINIRWPIVSPQAVELAVLFCHQVRYALSFVMSL